MSLAADPDRPSLDEARAVLATLAPTDRFQRRRVFLAVLAWLTQEDRG